MILWGVDNALLDNSMILLLNKLYDFERILLKSKILLICLANIHKPLIVIKSTIRQITIQTIRHIVLLLFNKLY
jgi:hypothetical protein